MTFVTIVNTQAKDELALLEVLEQLRERGDVGPQSLVESARPAASPVHHLFEWDDTVAGERYRLEQARLYIARVEYVPAPVREPYLVEMKTVAAKRAATEARCLTGVDMTLCSIDRMQAELEDIRKRYADCPALESVVEGPLETAIRQLSQLALDLPMEYEDDLSA